MHMETPSVILGQLNQELRRGTLVLCVLSQLKSPEYGYSLIQRLANKGLHIEQNTLYPLLRRLEKQGLVDSNWSVEEARPRRYYQLSEQGQHVLTALTTEWENMNIAINSLLKEEAKR